MSTLQETVSSEKIDTNLLSRFSCDLLRFLEDLDEAWVTYFNVRPGGEEGCFFRQLTCRSFSPSYVRKMSIYTDF